MLYTTDATAKTPALIIYLIDISASMGEPLEGKRKIDVAMNALDKVLKQMVRRSMRGSRCHPRYRIAMVGYSDDAWEILKGVKTIDQVANLGVPEPQLLKRTDTARGFGAVAKLLKRELPGMQNCPAPLVCHLTDGLYNGEDPETIAREIMHMHVPDGNVLIENVFISDQILPQPITNPTEWSGILPTDALTDEYAKKLRSISSPLPDSYREMMRDLGYHGLSKDAVMMLPGTSVEMVEMAFAMSGTTPTYPSSEDA